MVIPIVGGGVLVALADLALAFMMLSAGLLALAILYWLIANSRGRLGGLPLIGGTIVGILNAVLQTVVVLAAAVSGVMQAQLHFAVHNLRIVLNYFLAPLFMPIMSALQGVSNRVWDYDHNAFPRIAAQFTSVWDHIRHYDFEVFPAITTTLTLLTNDVTLLGRILFPLATRVEGLAGRVADYDQNAFPRIAARFATDAAALAELQGYLPLLRTLAEFESGAVRGIEGIAGDLASLRDIVRTHTGQLALLIGLSVIAAAGAEGIRELRCISTLKCSPLNDLLQSDLDERVTALEVDHG